MSFILTTDTSCDMFKKELDGEKIPWIPLTYTIKGETFDDNFSSDPEYQAFYESMLDGTMPTTSQINSFAHAEFFTKLLSESGEKSIVHLTLSGGLSDTVNSARVAADEVMKNMPGTEIYIVDTLSATQGHRHLVKRGLSLRDEGVTAKDAAKRLDECAPKIQHWFMVDDLHHLRRGGRIGGASAVIGTMLKIKPVLVINGKGKLEVVKKVHGVKKAIDYFISAIAENTGDEDGEFIIVNANAHGYAAELKERIEAAYPNRPVSIGWVGPIIGAHVGSGMFGVTFVGKERMK